MKIPLSLNVNYLPDWGVWEGIRELVQNGKDAETELEAPLKVSHKNQTLVIENEGASMEREALLFGTTSKTDREDLIGKFGEGLKLGMLALVRAGRPIKIRVGGEVWTPNIEKSDGFKANVLVVDIKTGNEPKKRVRVEVGGVTSVEWEELRERFLFLTEIKDDERVKVYSGDLLLGERFKHKVYVKGIWVQDKPKLHYGYNFKSADVDRDRKMVSSFDMDWTAASIWKDAANTRPDLFGKFIALATEDAEDVRGIADHGMVGEQLAAQAAAKFKTQFGADALPVSTTAESEQVEHLGAKGVIVSKTLARVLEPKLGGREELVKRIRESVVKVHAWGDLEPCEQENLTAGIDLIAKVHPACSLARVNVVDFNDDDYNGMWKDATCHIARHVLANASKTRRILLHEFAHEYGEDGTKTHVLAIEQLWEALVEHLLGEGHGTVH